MAVMNIKQYQRLQERRIKELKKVGRRGPLKSARFMVLQARRFAPRKTNKLASGIVKKKSKSGYTVSSSVPGSFKYNRWAAKIPGIYLRPRMRWNKRNGVAQPTLYGSGPAIYTGDTGLGYWKRAILLTMRHYPRIMREGVRKALLVRV